MLLPLLVLAGCGSSKQATSSATSTPIIDTHEATGASSTAALKAQAHRYLSDLRAARYADACELLEAHYRAAIAREHGSCKKGLGLAWSHLSSSTTLSRFDAALARMRVFPDAQIIYRGVTVARWEGGAWRLAEAPYSALFQRNVAEEEHEHQEVKTAPPSGDPPPGR